MNNHTQASVGILDTALKMYKPSTIILSYSGGYDSMVSSHLAARWAKQHAHSANVITLSADTKLSADGWADYIRASSKALKFPRLHIYETHKFKRWQERIIDKGFPFRLSQHKINFYYLKQVCFKKAVQDFKKHYHDHVMFINGVRRAESNDRRNAKDIAKYGSGIYVNAIAHWDDKQVYDYRMAYDMPINPFYDTVGNSGDCLCNWHTRIKLPQLREFGTCALQHIQPLHDATRDKFGYGYGEQPPNGLFVKDAPVQESFLDLIDLDSTPNLCIGCEKPTPTNESLNNYMMQYFNWSE